MSTDESDSPSSDPASSRDLDEAYRVLDSAANVQAPGDLEGVPATRAVTGWLLLLCWVLTIVGPVLGTAVTAYSLSTLVPLVDRAAGLTSYIAVSASAHMLLVAFSIFAGLRLWRVRPNAVPIAIAYLALSGTYAVVAEPALRGMVSGIQWTDRGNSGVVGTVLWIGYLLRSKQVRRTYGSDAVAS